VPAEASPEPAPAETPAPTTPAWRRALASTSGVAAVLAAGTFLLFFQVATHGFIRFDDSRYLTENAVVQRGLTWSGVAWAFTTLHASNWHPLSWLSHMLDVQLFGMAPGPMHLVNAALHAVNAALLHLVLVRMTRAPGRSAFVAALFAVHPLHVESVAWLAERKDVLSTFFGLLALLAYVAHAERPRARTLALVAGAFALSLLAKPMWVTLPCLLLLLDAWPLGRVAGLVTAEPGAARFPVQAPSRILLEKAPLLALSLASSAVTVVAQDRGGALSGLELPFGSRLGNASISYVVYVAKTLWPARLTVFYPFGDGLSLGAGLAAGAAIAAVTAVALACWRRAPWAAVGWCWFVGTLVPVIGIVQVGGQALADRYTYLPSVGLFIVLAWGAHRLAGAWRGGTPLAAAGLAVALGLAAATVRQLSFWRTHELLFRHALDVTAENALAHGSLADELRVQGRLDEALTHAREAVRIEPRSSRHWNNLALSLREAGILAEARDAGRRSVELNPRNALAWRVLGIVELDLNDLAAATDAFERAVQLAPEEPNFWFNLGIAYAKAMRVPDALRAYEETVRLAPRHFGAWTNLAGIYQFAGRSAEAGRAFETATRTEPGNPMGWRNLGVFLAKTGRPGAAVPAFQEALRLKPRDPDVLFRLGLAQLAAGARADALGTAAQLDGVAPAAAAELRARAGP
jgi:Flp pilus assembly protein TadD